MDTYKTKDIFEAAWIYSQEISLLRLDPDEKYSWFVFADKERCEALSNDYWGRKAVGNIKQFVSSLKSLKDLVFSKNRNKS